MGTVCSALNNCDLQFRLLESPYNRNVPAMAANKGQLCERSVSAAAINKSRQN